MLGKVVRPLLLPETDSVTHQYGLFFTLAGGVFDSFTSIGTRYQPVSSSWSASAHSHAFAGGSIFSDATSVIGSVGSDATSVIGNVGGSILTKVTCKFFWLPYMSSCD
jgi:hypothetical protein